MGRSPAALALLVWGFAAGCGSGGWAQPRSVLDAQVLARAARPARAERQTATGFYRDWLAWTWGSHCHMVPTDSEYFDQVVARCGAIPGMVAGVSRLLTEIEATPASHAPIATLQQTRWLAPPPPAACWR